MSYDLSLVDDDVYVISYRVSSSIPANNYDVAEYCVDGTIYTIQGEVTIVYTNDTPTMTLSQNKLVRGNRAIFYIPIGSVLRNQGVGLR